MDDGTTPTVAQAAESARVSRTTAYRYFPTQESLLLEVALHAHVDDLEALVAEPVDAEHAVERALDVLHRFNERVLAEEVRYRNAMRVYQELWFDASRTATPPRSSARDAGRGGSAPCSPRCGSRSATTRSSGWSWVCPCSPGWRR